MKSIKLFGLLATLAALAVPLFGASAAQAATHRISCSFTGATGDVNGDVGVQSISADAQDGTVVGDPGAGGSAGGGSGSYQYSTASATCQVDTGLPDAAASIVASGTFVNDLCGNIGTAPGDATVTVHGVPYSGHYGLSFRAAGVGNLEDDPNTPAVEDVSGAVDILPTAGNCGNSNVTTFQASGAFTGTLSD